MFGKILKQDILRSWRTLTGIWVGGLIFTIVTMGLSVALVKLVPIVSTLLMAAGNITVYVIVIGTLAITTHRYNATLHGKAAYFTMTIPAKSGTVVWAKLTYALIVNLIGMAVAAATTFVVSVGSACLQGMSLINAIKDVINSMSVDSTLLTIVIFAMVAGIMLFWISIASVISFANSTFMPQGVAKGWRIIISLVLMWVVYQVIMIASLFVIPYAVRMEGSDFSLIYANLLGGSTELQNAIPLGLPLGGLLLLALYISLIHACIRRPNLAG